MPDDSVKTEGQDYVRAGGLPAPQPLILTDYVHGEFSHQFTTREHNTLAWLILERHNLDETITSSWTQA